jgi:hypothetical protein
VEATLAHQFYQLDSWLRMLEANASGRGLTGKLKAVPAVLLIHCYNQGIGPTISALDAYARESLDASVMMPGLEGATDNGERVLDC